MSKVRQTTCVSSVITPMTSETSSLKIEWLNSQEAADFLRISKKTLMNLTSNGKVPFYKFGTRNRYQKEQLNQLLLQNKRGQNGN